MKQYKVLRAEETWQCAGAYSVRVQGMNRQHHISLREEFDEHDGDESKYIVILDDTYPVATCRFYELDQRSSFWMIPIPSRPAAFMNWINNPSLSEG